MKKIGKMSKTAKASMRGTKSASTKVDSFDTNEKKIKELRSQRKHDLAVNRFDFIDALLEEYDKAVASCTTLGTAMKALADKTEGIVSDRDAQIEDLRNQVANLTAKGSPTPSQTLQAELEPLPASTQPEQPVTTAEEADDEDEAKATAAKANEDEGKGPYISLDPSEEKMLDADAEADREEESKEPHDHVDHGGEGG